MKAIHQSEEERKAMVNMTVAQSIQKGAKEGHAFVMAEGGYTVLFIPYQHNADDTMRLLQYSQTMSWRDHLVDNAKPDEHLEFA